MYNSINICKILHIFCVSDKLANEEDIYIYIYIYIYLPATCGDSGGERERNVNERESKVKLF